MRLHLIALAVVLIAGCRGGGSKVAPGNTGPDGGAAANGADEVSAPTHPALRDELLAMRDADQALRAKWIAEGASAAPELGRQVMEMDAARTARLREIVDEHGWPTRSMVGAEGASAAWLLVQHASGDVDFQRESLELMEPLVDEGEASAVELAFLADRVRTGEGRPQIYGTQFRPTEAGLEPFPIEDPEHVDERRAKLGLEPLAEYKAQLLKAYGMSEPEDAESRGQVP